MCFVVVMRYIVFFFFNDTATTEIYTLSLHDALPISSSLSVPLVARRRTAGAITLVRTSPERPFTPPDVGLVEDRKSTRLNSSHANISYAVFCLKKKKKQA